ncbi:MAG: ATP-dependent Lon protease [Paracoccus sp. BP8]|nr:MAG: ATP-dependent Lon protease [Paracoccus sp. BP8]
MKLSPNDRAWFDKVLRAIAAAEAGPSEADLAQAPVLKNWSPAISPRGHVILWGEVIGHPILDSDHITTSQLIAIDPEAGWARTASRWYRLGRSIDTLEAKLAESLNGKNTEVDAVRFTLPGFANINDSDLLQTLLTEYIARVREIDAADRAASGREE